MSRGTRKLQKLAGGSFTITLPPDWVRRNGLEGGEELVVVEGSNFVKLMIPQKVEAKRSIKFTDQETTTYLLSVLYMQGISEVTVESNGVIPQEAKRRMRELQRELIGLELVEEGFNFLKFKVKDEEGSTIGQEVSRFAEKVVNIAKDLSEGANNSIMLNDVAERAAELTRDYRAVIRRIARAVQLNEEDKLPPKDVILIAVGTRDLGRLLSHLESAARTATNCRSLHPKVLEGVRTLAELVSTAVNVFLTEDLDKVPEVRRGVKSLSSMGDLDSDVCSREVGKEIARTSSYIMAIMDDGVHKSVRL